VSGALYADSRDARSGATNPSGIATLALTLPGFAGERRDHRCGYGQECAPQGGVTVVVPPKHFGGGGQKKPSTKVQVAPDTEPGWNGNVRCHQARCYNNVE
jgi:hypothetical protein